MLRLKRSGRIMSECGVCRDLKSDTTVVPPDPWFHFSCFQLLMVNRGLKILNEKLQN